MNGDWSQVFLGVIAAATIIMAVMQIGTLITMLNVTRQMIGLLASVQNELKPLVARATALADEASQTVALMASQAEKVDRLVTDLSRRAEETADVVQQAIVVPLREGMAIVSAFRAGLSALRGLKDLRPRHSRHAEDEDPLFIG